MLNTKKDAVFIGTRSLWHINLARIQSVSLKSVAVKNRCLRIRAKNDIVQKNLQKINAFEVDSKKTGLELLELSEGRTRSVSTIGIPVSGTGR